jgi:signal transduction histidine kinase
MTIQKDARASTDESLETERRKTDDELIRNRAEHAADGTVKIARGRADALVLRAREHEDRDLSRAEPSGRSGETRARERDAEDHRVAVDRAAADALLGDERDQGRRMLAAFLDRERTATDDRLDGERSTADQAVASRDDVLGMVSHDLKTMLAAMSLSAQVLLAEADRVTAGSRICDAAKRIQRLVGSMSRLVSDLLDVASIDAGRMAVHPEPNDAVRLLGDALDAFRPLAAASGVRLDGDVHRAPLMGWFDDQRILQVIANLLSNAIKFSPRGTAIEVSVERVREELLFTVRDEGRGIAAPMLSSIFERFRQVSPGGRTGLGLGLFISKRIVEAHGGRIWAESAIGQGSTFRVALPDGREPTPAT